jgi:hypothetical protein
VAPVIRLRTVAAPGAAGGRGRDAGSQGHPPLLATGRRSP